MKKKNYSLYDIFDLKRLGDNKSFLLQFDCIFVREGSNLLNVKFWNGGLMIFHHKIYM